MDGTPFDTIPISNLSNYRCKKGKRLSGISTCSMVNVMAAKRLLHILLLITLLLTISCGGKLTKRLAEDVAGRYPEVLFYVDTERHAVALTIDDGPNPETTEKILDLLKQNDAHATFFIITDRVPGNEHLLERMVAENHEIGNHLVRMEPSIRLTPEEFERQLLASHDVLSNFSPVRWFRPGSGWYNDSMLKTLKKYDYRCALGSVYPFDPQIRWSWFSTRYILRNVFPGSIIVLHDGGTFGHRTITTLSKVLPELKRRGYHILTLTALVSLRSA